LTHCTDFGAGPFLFDPERQQMRRAWAFVMTLCFSRLQYIEFVFDQTVPTWLGLHRRAFEWFGQVPRRLIIDNPKCGSRVPVSVILWCSVHTPSGPNSLALLPAFSPQASGPGTSTRLDTNSSMC
jgi:hypothetical protein